MDSQIFTPFHVGISLIGILSGLIVAYGLITDQRMPFLTAIFLLTTVATSVTGFFFHRDHNMPGHILGVISLLVLLPACYGLYLQNLRGFWRGGGTLLQCLCPDRTGLPENSPVARIGADRV
jgi:hypothetical protein